MKSVFQILAIVAGFVMTVAAIIGVFAYQVGYEAGIMSMVHP